MISEKPQSIQMIVGSVRRIVRSVYQDSRTMKKRFGLTGPQSAVMRSLHSLGPMSSAALSRVLYVSPANITGIVDRLEKNGWVSRNRSAVDRRITMIELTPSGLEMCAHLSDPIEDRLVRGLSDLGMKEIADIRGVLAKVVELLDAKEIDDAPITADSGSWESAK